MDPADISSHASETERARRVANRVRYQGISAKQCADCDEPIDARRRAAIPGCQRCCDCQDIHDRRQRR